MSLGLLARQPLTWDSEAAAYILQVEAADGQSLELGVARAINQFVIDCKVRGIWGAIKSCCLLSGARTLNGALIPLKGAAPTNINFINSDYNRETGLKGDGSSKYINTNRNYASDPQNNQHMCVYISSPDSKDQALGSVGYIAAGTSTGAGNIGKDGSNSRIYFRNQNSTVYTTNFNISEGVGLIGSSRTNSDSYSIRLVGRNLSFNQSSQTPLSSNIFIFAFPGSPATFYTNARLSFYSIGESLDLRLLDQCVSSLRQNFLRAISTYSISDTDAANYVRRVELADGFILENAVKIAIDNLVIGLKADGLWPSIKACCILSGAKTLSGILTPLVGIQPESVNFTEDHYNRSLGLTGLNNSPRYLNSKRRGNSDPQNNHHMCVYRTSGNNINIFIGSIIFGSVVGDMIGSTGQNTQALWTKSRTINPTSTPNYNSGGNFLIGIARNNANNYEIIGNNLTATINAASSAPSSNNIYVFSGANTSNQGGGVGSNTDARLSFYSIGEYLDLSLLDARLDTFMTALSNANI